MVPSYSESFGLVAVEAQACGTPVVAAVRRRPAHRRPGRRVRDPVDGHDPARYARAPSRELIAVPGLLARLSARGQEARLRVRLGRHGRPAARRVRRGDEHLPGHESCTRDGRHYGRHGWHGRSGGPATRGPARAASEIEAALADLGLAAERPQPGSFLVRLEGQHKLATMTWLIAGAHSLHVEAFFCRQPDENHAAFYRFLLERGSRMFGIHFALDPVGDVYLVGRLPLAVDHRR